MSALVDKAKQVDRYVPNMKSVGKTIDEDIDLAWAWAEDQLSSNQVLHAMGRATRGNNNALYSFLATRLREGVRRGRIVLKSEGEG